MVRSSSEFYCRFSRSRLGLRMTILLTVFLCVFAPPLAVLVSREQKDDWHFALNFLLFYTVIPAQIHAFYFCFLKKCISKRNRVPTAVPGALPVAPQKTQQPPKPTLNITNRTQNNDVSGASTTRAPENAPTAQLNTVTAAGRPTNTAPTIQLNTVAPTVAAK
ncbi:hypothetical protein M3Y96_00112500 [Aphelenchoides besseyi]|nr:hypothetical protein M3Y96_00112500 [Aphelenchoides besseyi]